MGYLFRGKKLENELNSIKVFLVLKTKALSMEFKTVYYLFFMGIVTGGGVFSAQQSEDNGVYSSANPWEWIHGMAHNSVVQIFNYRSEFNWIEPYKTPAQGGASGSGFFIDQDGHLITNAHVVGQAQALFIQVPFFGKERFEVLIEGVCPQRDLALLKVKPDELDRIKVGLGGELPTLALGDSDKVARADDLLALGYPLGQQALKSTKGIVSGRENVEGSFMIQIDAPINPGSSGGPSLNKRGEVVGINTVMAIGAQNVGYIIPSNEVQLFLKQLEFGTLYHGMKILRKPFLGVLFNDSSENVALYLKNPLPGGPYVLGVYPNSPFDKAGIKKGDMIYQVDGHQLDYYGDIEVDWSEDKVSVIDYVSRLMLGKDIHIVYYRQGKRLETVVKFDFSGVPPVRMRHADYESIDYEVIGGLVVMELAINHIPVLVKNNPRLDRFVDFENQMKPVLILTHILNDSEAMRSRILYSGAIIAEVNGTPVSTLEEFRKVVKRGSDKEFLTVELEEHLFVALSVKRIKEEEYRLAHRNFYTVTPFAKEFIKA